ncbi:MAG: flagellar biosynthesis protein FliC [Gammaproteobacteria bacterium]|nr:MAG: flagellar biosynthesis protein FliC [Gammaproteobacteria bacterium]
MALVINTNTASINTQRQLMNSGTALDQATQRLSSGQRINSAKDDAAGLAISNRMTSQIRGLDQAVRNANDGVSMIQTADGALTQTTNILQRMRELAVQSSNGIYNDADRGTLNAESEQLKQELDRIANTTSFNGKNLLDGNLGSTSLQVGAYSSQSINFTIGNFTTNALGGSSTDVVGKATTIAAVKALTNTAAAAPSWSVNDTDIGDLSAVVTVNDALKVINTSLDGKGAVASASTELKAGNVGSGVLKAGTDKLTIAVKDADGNTQSYVLTGTNNMDELVKKINSETSVQAKLNESGKLVLTKAGSESITATDNTTSQAASGILTAANSNTFSIAFTDTSSDKKGVKVEVNASAGTDALLIAAGFDEQSDTKDLQGADITAVAGTSNDGDININGVAIKSITFTATTATDIAAVIKQLNAQSAQTGVVASAGSWKDGAAAASTTAIQLTSTTGKDISIKYGENATSATVLKQFGFKERNAAEGTGSVSSVNISTQAGAQSSLAIIDKAIDQVSSSLANLGAVSNRLDFTVSNLSSISEKTTSARSRIVDADFASETASLSRATVLQQAATAMLAQANQRPQNVLSLLR